MKALLSILLFSLLTFSSYGAETIKIGVRSYYPPFEMVLDKTKHVSGFEVTLIMEVCKRLNLDCVFVPLKFEELFASIASETISLAIGAIIITEERQGNFLFSVPYLLSDGQFVTKLSNRYDSIPVLCSKKIGLVKGSLFKAIVMEQCKENPKIVEFPVVLDAYNELANESIDSVMTDEKGARYWIANNSGQYKLVGAAIPLGLGYGIMANFKEQSLVEDINKVLADIKADGTYLKIYQLYFGPEN